MYARQHPPPAFFQNWTLPLGKKRIFPSSQARSGERFRKRKLEIPIEGECDLGKEGSDRILLHPDSAITLASGRSALLVSLYIPHDETVTLKKFGRRMLCGGYHIKAARPAARRVTELGMGGRASFSCSFLSLCECPIFQSEMILLG